MLLSTSCWPVEVVLDGAPHLVACVEESGGVCFRPAFSAGRMLTYRDVHGLAASDVDPDVTAQLSKGPVASIDRNVFAESTLSRAAS